MAFGDNWPPGASSLRRRLRLTHPSNPRWIGCGSEPYIAERTCRNLRERRIAASGEVVERHFSRGRHADD